MRNDGGVLRDRTGTLGIKPIGDLDVTFADVTGDGRRDLIQLSHALLRVSRRTDSGYRIVVEARLDRAVGVAAGDVDGDGAADIYVARGDMSGNQRDLLMLSRQGGRKLVPIRIPQTDRGTADDVFALDYDDNGRADFVVLNGRRRPGPIQLLAAFPG
jgi:VCBS repeat protein